MQTITRSDLYDAIRSAGGGVSIIDAMAKRATVVKGDFIDSPSGAVPAGTECMHVCPGVAPFLDGNRTVTQAINASDMRFAWEFDAAMDQRGFQGRHVLRIVG